MKPGLTMRVARPTDNLAAIADMYVKGLGLTVLIQFEDHRGFDGSSLPYLKEERSLDRPAADWRPLLLWVRRRWFSGLKPRRAGRIACATYFGERESACVLTSRLCLSTTRRSSRSIVLNASWITLF